ncbi:MAG: hypothetical protein AAGC74_12895 [Verrucomicrobiota bacterium]
MLPSLVRHLIPLKFKHTSRQAADQQLEAHLRTYLKIAQKIGPDGSKPVSVPSMLGVDEDMRAWSFFELLAHNTIVNLQIAKIIPALVKNENLSQFDHFNPKTDVHPPPECGPDEVTRFEKSIRIYQKTLARLDNLNSSQKRHHPVFGPFDAHQWHCMCAFHLKIHLKQAQTILKLATA